MFAKYTIICLLSIGLVQNIWCQLNDAQVKTFLNDCVKSTGATEDDRNEFIARFDRPQMAKNMSRTAQCLGSCWLQKAQIMDNENKLILKNLDLLTNLLIDIDYAKPEERKMLDVFRGIAQECTDKESDFSDACTAAHNFWNCFLPKASKRATKQ